MDTVTVQETVLTLPTYPQPPAQDLPMFSKHRIHQRSSGNPYPNKVVVSVDRTIPQDRDYTLIRLENTYLRIEILPQLGGRIYSALDKTTGYDFFYKQHVIKPALIGLLGSWVSGGCEFNWPCHHRPSTFMPTDYTIEHSEDGSVTVWLSEHEPLNRMKGMVGIRLKPDEAVFDTLIQVYNRTEVRRSFLWWENAAVPVHRQYRLFFPPDVHHVNFHYRKNITSYPIASGVYNGIHFGDGTDISHHKNTKHPTSFFSAETAYDFFGGYDERRRCGVVHTADRYTSVGKKMFTWAYGQLGRSWENALTDSDGAYAELMASSYSNNQPDFAWLEAYETKRFSQSWYPIGDTGIPLCANRHAAVALCKQEIRIQATRSIDNAVITYNGLRITLHLQPGIPVSVPFEGEINEFILYDSQAEPLLQYQKQAAGLHEMPEPLADNPSLDSLQTAQDCYLAGVHVEQYRDPLITPDAYYREALDKDPCFIPALTALARVEYVRANFSEAESFALRACRGLTARNFHPESGTHFYILGLILEALGRDADAVNWYQKAAWNQDARSKAMTRIARIDGRCGAYGDMETHAREALAASPQNAYAGVLLAVAQLHRRNTSQANGQLDSILQRNPLYHLAAIVRSGANDFFQSIHTDACQTALDVAEDLCGMGENALAYAVLQELPQQCAMTQYAMQYLAPDLGKTLDPPMNLPIGIAYPLRHFEIKVLQNSIANNAGDAVAQNLLACVLYHFDHREEAQALWKEALENDPGNYSLYRNLAVVLANDGKSAAQVLPMLRKAWMLKTKDEQLIFEYAHLALRMGTDPSDVLRFLKQLSIQNTRDDILIEWVRALNLNGDYQRALALLAMHTFTPCEGGEHAIAEQYMFAHHVMGIGHYQKAQYEQALVHFQNAQVLPSNLGAGLWNHVLLVPHQYYEALCLQQLNRIDEAQTVNRHILQLKVDYFSHMYLPELACWQAKVYRDSGKPALAKRLLSVHVSAIQRLQQSRLPGYFKATPFFISYQPDPQSEQQAYCNWQMAMAYWAADDPSAAKTALAVYTAAPTHLYAKLLSGQFAKPGTTQA